MCHFRCHCVYCAALGLVGRECGLDPRYILFDLRWPYIGTDTASGQSSWLHRDYHDILALILGAQKHASLDQEKPGGPQAH